MIAILLQIFPVFMLLSLFIAMVIYQIWFNKPAPPVYYRRKKKIGYLKYRDVLTQSEIKDFI